MAEQSYVPGRRLTPQEMMQMNGQTPEAISNARNAKVPPIWFGPAGGVLPTRGGIESAYPATAEEKKAMTAASELCKRESAVLERAKTRGVKGGELDPTNPEEKKVIDELKSVFGIAKDSEVKMIVNRYNPGNKHNGEGLEILAQTPGKDKPISRLVYAPALDRTMFLTGAETQKNVEQICKAGFAVLDKNPELYKKIKEGDLEALGKLSPELGRAIGLKEGEAPFTTYQPASRNIVTADGEKIRAKVEMVVFRQPTGNMLKIERAFGPDGNPIESGYRLDPGLITVGALKANLK